MGQLYKSKWRFYERLSMSASHTFHFTLFTSTVLRIYFEVLFSNLYLGALCTKNNEIKNIYRKSLKKYGKL